MKRKVLIPALTVLLLSSAGIRRVAQGQTTTTGLSGSWIGVVTLTPNLAVGINNGINTVPIMLTYNSNGTVTEIIQGGGWVVMTALGLELEVRRGTASLLKLRIISTAAT